MTPGLIWIIAGVLLILSEFVIPGFIIGFFGVAAVIVGGISCFAPWSAVWQLLTFALLGVVLLIGCRRFMPGVFKGKAVTDVPDIDGDDVKGKECVCVEEISSAGEGKVEFRGALWSAKSDEEIKPGSHCEVIARENVTLIVKAKF